MEIRQLRSFIHISQLGSFSLAAERLNIVQPALSRQIHLLEEELGARLFHRTGRGVILTSEGELLLNRAEIILREIDAAFDELKDSRKINGEISLGLPPTVSEVLAGPIIEDFAAKFPDVRLKVVSGYSGHVLDWLQKGAIDVAVLYDTGRKLPTIKSKPLIRENLFFIQKAGGGESPASMGFAQAAAERLVLPGAEHGLRLLLDAHAVRSGLALKPLAETDSLPAQIDLVRRGFASTILPLMAVYAMVERGELVATKIVQPDLSRTLLFATAIDRQAKPSSEMLAKSINSRVSELTRSGLWPGAVKVDGSS